MHTLELYGSEGCCDGTTSWKFKVGSSKWLTFTAANLNVCFAKEKFVTKKCAKNQFKCNNGKQCIAKADFCDGTQECSDGSDEIKEICCANPKSKYFKNAGCGPKVTPKDCKENEYKCNDGQCILQSFYCNGVKNCKDGSDEILSLCCAGDFTVYDEKTCEFKNNNTPGKCTKNEFTCDNGECITRSLYCDGTADCSDGSDENRLKCCAARKFKAYNKKECKPKTVVPEEPRDAVIYIKTTSFKKNTVTYISELKQKMTQKSPKGFCEKVV
jgi:hypothetical protein